MSAALAERRKTKFAQAALDRLLRLMIRLKMPREVVINAGRIVHARPQRRRDDVLYKEDL